jgi:hypothetical protein
MTDFWFIDQPNQPLKLSLKHAKFFNNQINALDDLRQGMIMKQAIITLISGGAKLGQGRALGAGGHKIGVIVN